MPLVGLVRPRRGSSSASTCRRRSRRPGRAPGRPRSSRSTSSSTRWPTKLLVSPRASRTGPSPGFGAVRTAPPAARGGRVWHAATVARVTHFCRESGKSCLLDVQKLRVVHFRSCGPATSSSCCATGSPGPGPARRRHRPGPLDDRRPDRRADAARAGGAVRRRRLHRRPPAVAVGAEPGAPGWSPASTSAPRTPALALADLAGTILAERREDLDVATGPGARARLGRAAIARAARRPEPHASPSSPRSASACPARSSTRPGGRSTRRSCPAGTATTCRPTCSGPSTCRC